MLKSEHYANQTIAFKDEVVSFDDKGIAKPSAKAEAHLGKFDFIEVVAEPKPKAVPTKPKAPAKSKALVEEVKKED